MVAHPQYDGCNDSPSSLMSYEASKKKSLQRVARIEQSKHKQSTTISIALLHLTKKERHAYHVLIQKITSIEKFKITLVGMRLCVSAASCEAASL